MKKKKENVLIEVLELREGIVEVKITQREKAKIKEYDDHYTLEF